MQSRLAEQEVNELQMLQTVALMIDLPEHGLRRGQAGVIVEELAPEVYEVEFSDTQGRAYAQLPLKTEQLMALRYAPMQAAACIKRPA